MWHTNSNVKSIFKMKLKARKQKYVFTLCLRKTADVLENMATHTEISSRSKFAF